MSFCSTSGVFFSTSGVLSLFQPCFFLFFHLTQLTRTLLAFWMDQLHFTESTLALAPCFLLIFETDGADETLKKVGRLTLWHTAFNLGICNLEWSDLKFQSSWVCFLVLHSTCLWVVIATSYYSYSVMLMRLFVPISRNHRCHRLQ